MYKPSIPRSNGISAAGGQFCEGNLEQIFYLPRHLSSAASPPDEQKESVSTYRHASQNRHPPHHRRPPRRRPRVARKADHGHGEGRGEAHLLELELSER